MLTTNLYDPALAPAMAADYDDDGEIIGGDDADEDMEEDDLKEDDTEESDADEEE